MLEHVVICKLTSKIARKCMAQDYHRLGLCCYSELGDSDNIIKEWLHVYQLVYQMFWFGRELYIIEQMKYF